MIGLVRSVPVEMVVNGRGTRLVLVFCEKLLSGIERHIASYFCYFSSSVCISCIIDASRLSLLCFWSARPGAVMISLT